MGHNARDEFPDEMDAIDRRIARKKALIKVLEDMELMMFRVGDLPAISRILGIGKHLVSCNDNDLDQIEKRVAEIKKSEAEFKASLNRIGELSDQIKDPTDSQD